MKLADWQKAQIEPVAKSGDMDALWLAIEKACSGGMHTNGPDRLAGDIRRIVMAYGHHSPNMIRELTQYVRDRVR